MSAIKRRDFLKMAAVGTCGAAIHNVMSPFGGLLAFADPGAQANGMTLILVNLAGGASYNITPPSHDAYKAKMPTVYPSAALALNSEQGLHPSLTAFKQIYDEGRLGLINMVGHMNENRSHEESTEIWMRGILNGSPANSSGWFARLACQMGGFLSAVSLSGSKLLIQGSCNPGKSLGNLSSFGEDSFWGGTSGTKWLRDIREGVITTANTPSGESGLYVTGAMVNLQSLLATIQQQTNITLPVTFPTTGFGNQCRDAAKLVAASGLGVKLIYLEKGGFDTHSNEGSSLTSLLNDINGGISALTNCLKALGVWDKVIIMTMSEFSRTFENGSAGTDHGHAAPMFVMGGSVNGGVKTPTPTPAVINAAGQYFKDSQIHVDFRQAFKEAVIKMGQDPNAIFTEPFTNTAYSNLGLFS